MNAGLLALGVSHKTAPLALRERLALPEGRAAGVLRDLTAHESIHEAVAISTCNRTELHLVTNDPVDAENAALGVLSRQADIRPTELVGHLYSLRDGDAVRHLFSVAVVARLDDRRRGRGAGPGQARLRARSRRGRHRPGLEPPLPRRARRRQARPHRDADRPLARVRVVGRGRARAADARRPRAEARPGRRRRRDRRADRSRAARARRPHGLRRQPPLRPRDRPGAALRGHRRPLRRAARPARRRRHRRVARPARRTS